MSETTLRRAKRSAASRASSKPGSSKKKSAGGRPPHEPTAQTRQLVEVLAGFGIPIEKIAEVIRVSKPTVMKHYAAELRTGEATVEAKLVGNLLRIANGTDGTALKAIMFALRCRFGWSEFLPRKPRELELGKKEAANRDALTAHRDSDWADLVH